MLRYDEDDCNGVLLISLVLLLPFSLRGVALLMIAADDTVGVAVDEEGVAPWY